MWQDFLICVNAVIPSAVYLIIGIVLRLAGIVTEEEVRKFTKVTFIALYPFLMFDNLYGKHIEDHISAKLIIFVVLLFLFQLITSIFYVKRFERIEGNRATMVQSLFRSNIVIMGLPIAVNLFGKANIVSVAVVLMVIVPLYNITAVVLFEKDRPEKTGSWQIALDVLKNPLIVGGLVAVIVMTLGIRVPQTLHLTIVTLSDTASPIAMILLGASLNLQGMKSDIKRIITCVFGKLVIFPAIGIISAVLIGLRGVDLIAVVLMVATPVALASYAMASSMGGNGRLAAETVVVSTIVACFTIPIWLFILKTNGLF